MRIGIDARELQGRPTGTGRYLRNLLREWTHAGRDSIVAYVRGTPPEDASLRHPAIEVRPLGGAGEPGLLWQQRTLPSAAAGDRLDVFFAPAYTCPLRLHVPRVTAIHDLSFFARPQEFALREGALRRMLTSASAHASARVLAISEFTRREIAMRFPAVAARVEQIPLGADDDLPPAPPRDVARAELGLGGPLILSVGTLFERRCVPELLRALTILSRRRPAPRLELVGENRTRPFRDYEGMAAQFGLLPHVRFTGFLDEPGLARRYAAADVAIALSLYEGFGLPAVEALARAVPLVAADRPALNEVVGEAALLVDPEDPPGIAAAIGRVLDDSELCARLRERGPARAASFSWRETARRTRDVLAAVAGA